jgi:hypothetical protein
LDQVDDAGEPALLFDCLVGFHASSLCLHAWVAGGLLHAFFHEYFEDLKHAFDVLGGFDLCSVLEDVAGDFSGDGSSCGVCLGPKEG